jgi:cell wall-associated NlpC family hydrolase
MKSGRPEADIPSMDGTRRLIAAALCLLALGASACGSAARSRPVVAPTGAEGGRRVASTAKTLVGAPYRLGGNDPSRGFDCSGLVAYVFGRLGYRVPRVVDQQFDVGKRVKPGQIQPGDLIFFAGSGKKPSHVAIALDRDSFVHAPSGGGHVRIERLSSAYWSKRFLAARRWL